MADEAELEQLASGRPMWSGTVTFGLVSVPVAILPANRPRQIALHMVSDDGQQLRRKYFTAAASKKKTAKGAKGRKHPKGPRLVEEPVGQELARTDIVRGYEVKKGKFVVVEDGELER